MKKLILAVLVLGMVVSSVQIASADSHCKQCGKRGMAGQKWGMQQKVMQKAHFFMKNEEELGLSEEQAAKIKALKHGVKKEMVKRKADIEIVAIDIKSALYEEKIDVKAVNKLIDQKYELKKAKAKYLVEQYATLKAMLSEEQMAMAKTIWKRCNK